MKIYINERNILMEASKKDLGLFKKTHNNVKYYEINVSITYGVCVNFFTTFVDKNSFKDILKSYNVIIPDYGIETDDEHELIHELLYSGELIVMNSAKTGTFYTNDQSFLVDRLKDSKIFCFTGELRY